MTDSAITFFISDPEGASQGFPGRVDCTVTYSVADGGRWNIKMEAVSPEAKTRRTFLSCFPFFILYFSLSVPFFLPPD